MKTIMRAVLLFAVSVSIGGAPAKTINATTEDGRRVLLDSDNTWRYADQQKPDINARSDYKKPVASKKLCKTVNSHFSFWIDEAKWTQKKTDDPNRFEFGHARGDAGAIVISERIGMTMDALKALVLENARKAAKDAAIISEEKRVVNGVPVACMRIEGTINGVFFTYLGYYYASEVGCLQVITYTGHNLFNDYKNDFYDFLNGVEITK